MNKLAALVLNTVNIVTFLVVLVGLPLALVSMVGWPGPTESPDLAKIESVITGREQVPPLFLIKGLTVVAWLIWVQLVLAMVEEIKAVRLDLVAKKSFVLPGIQKFVASAVLAIMLLVNGLKPASAAPLATPAPIAQPFRAEQSELPATQVLAQTSETTTTKSYVTQAGDSWWQVAETFLDDGARFDELRELNVGKSFDGLIVQDDSDYLGVGWNIELPADAKAVTTITVQPGDTLSELENDHGLQNGDLAEVNDIDSPDLIHPGQKLDVSNPITESKLLGDAHGSETPADDAARPSTAPPAANSVPDSATPTLQPGNPVGSGQQALPLPQTQEPAVSQNDPGSQADGDVNVGGRIAVGSLLSALAFLAPALWSVRRRRFRASLRTVTTGQLDVLPLDEVDAASMAAAASYGDDDFMDVVLRLVGQRMSSTRQDPGLLAMTVDDDAGHLLFEQAPTFEPGPGFTAVGKKWTAERPGSLTQLRSQASISIVPYPAMVSLGAINGSAIAVNLEQLGGLNIVGSQSEVREIMFNIAVELASSNLAETIRVVVIGFNMSLPGLERVEQYDTLPAELSNMVKVESPGLKRLLTVDPASSQPVIVISPDMSLKVDALGANIIPVLANRDEPELADLIVYGPLVSLPRLGFNNVERIRLSPREICEYLKPVNTTRSDRAESTTSQTVSSTQPQPRPQPSGTVIDLLPVEPGVASSQVVNLVADKIEEMVPAEAVSPIAFAARVTGPANLPLTNLPPVERPDPVRSISPLDLGFTFVVSVLGPIELDGVGLADPERSWRYTKTAELVVLLATSDVPRTGDALKEMLWPGRDPIKCGPSLANATSDARIRVVGEERFPKLAPGNTLYKVDGIGTDLDLFEENLDRAKATESPAASMGYRRAALSLVEGLPFDSFAHKSSGYGWADTLMMSATVQIVNVAVELSRWDFKREEYVLAADAAEKGLRAAPENYELLDLYGKASLAASDHDRARGALAKIMDVENEYIEGTPGLSEPELPTELRETQTDLQKYLRYDSA